MLSRMATPFRKRGGRFKAGSSGVGSCTRIHGLLEASAEQIIVAETRFAFGRKSVGVGRRLRPTGVL